MNSTSADRKGNMTAFENKFVKFLSDAERLLEFADGDQSWKWVLISRSQIQRRPFHDPRTVLSHSFARAAAAIAKLPSNADAITAFEQDPVFSQARRKGGQWGAFQAVMQSLILSSGRVRGHKIRLDSAKAVERLRSIRNSFSQQQVQYRASARFLGVGLRCKELPLPDHVILHRLTQAERTARQPIFTSYSIFGWEENLLAYHSTEASLPVAVHVDHSQELAFFKAQNEAQNVAAELFVRVLDAILIASSGVAKLGPLDFSGGIDLIPMPRTPVERPPSPNSIKIKLSDLKRLETAYELISNGPRADSVLGRSLRRFLLGRKRTDQIDRLVDFVTAWEAILLTQAGNALAQELAYRFSINGASILRVAKGFDPGDGYRKMRAAYAARSWAVHGGDDRKRDEALRDGGFANLQELCDFLEQGFRAVVFWLAEQEPAARPYSAVGGWEELLWS